MCNVTRNLYRAPIRCCGLVGVRLLHLVAVFIFNTVFKTCRLCRGLAGCVTKMAANHKLLNAHMMLHGSNLLQC